MPIKISGTKRESTKAMIYPGMTNHWIEIPVSTRSIASPTLAATPICIQRFIILTEMAPLVTVST